MSENLSPNQKAMRRLLRNKPALFGLAVIAVSILVALFGYVIAPDATPNANDQISAVALKNPGFKVKMLKMRKNREIERPNWLSKMLFGAPSEFDFVPINGAVFPVNGEVRHAPVPLASQILMYYKYVGEYPTTGQLLRGKGEEIHPVDVIYAINPDNKKITATDKTYTFFNLKNQPQTVEGEQVI